MKNHYAQDLRPLAALRNLRVLCIRSYRGGDAYDLSPIAQLTLLEELDITFLAKNLEPLQSLAKLRVLRMGGSKATDVRPLAALTKLRVLDLSCDGINDISPLFGKLRHLEEITLPCHIDCHNLQSQLPALRRLKHGGADNCIHGGHQTTVNLAELIRCHKQAPLRELDLRKVSFDNYSQLEQFDSLEKLSCQVLGECDWITKFHRLVTLELESFAAPLDFLDKLPALRELTLHRSDDLSALLPMIALHQQLTSLRLLSCFDRENVALLLPLMTGLKTLAIPSAAIENVTFVAHMPLLEYLDIRNERRLALAPLKKCRALKSLVVSSWRIGLATIASLQCFHCDSPCKSLGPLTQVTQLEELIVSSPTRDFQPLRGMTRLRVLRMYGSKAEDVTVLGQLVTLQELILPDTCAADLEPLGNLTELCKLNVQGNCVATSFAFLRRLTAMEHLEIAHTNLSDLSVCANMLHLRRLVYSASRAMNVASAQFAVRSHLFVVTCDYGMGPFRVGGVYVR